MCIFSGVVGTVDNTKIFARLDGAGGQYLAYQMRYEAARDLAMILPIPVSSHAENAVEFVSLQDYEDFFLDLDEGFPQSQLASIPRSIPVPAAIPTLTVHDVGAYEASFVPTLDDFERLDQRFRLPRQVWDKIPTYADWGFAVFKLRPTTRPFAASSPQDRGRRVWDLSSDPEHGGTWGNPTSGDQAGTTNPVRNKVHPMVFRFPTREPGFLFFPTVHIHDGTVHPKEQFDHRLYFQGVIGEDDLPRNTEATYKKASHFMDLVLSGGAVDGELHCYRHDIRGLSYNEDIWIATA